MTETAFAALVMILAGAVARRTGLLSRDDGHVLVNIVIYIAMPALIFLILLRAELESSLILVPIAGYLIHFSLLALAYVSTRVRGMERPRAGAVMVASAVGNTGFFGIPLIAASGAGFSLAAAVMYDALATGVITWTSTVMVSTAFGGDAPHIDVKALGRALLLPPNLALAAGLAVNMAGVDDLPALIERPLELLGAAVLPLVMIYAGLLVELRGLGRVLGEIGYVTVVRLGLAALLGLGVAMALGLEGDTLNTVVVMAAMPTAMMSLVLGANYGLRSDILAGAVVVTTVLATLTLPAIRALLL